MIYGYANASWLGLDKFRDRAPERDVRTVAPLPPVVIGFGQRTIDATPSATRIRRRALPDCRICDAALLRGAIDGAHKGCFAREQRGRAAKRAVAATRAFCEGGLSMTPLDTRASLPTSTTHVADGNVASLRSERNPARPCGAERARCVRGAR